MVGHIFKASYVSEAAEPNHSLSGCNLWCSLLGISYEEQSMQLRDGIRPCPSWVVVAGIVRPCSSFRAQEGSHWCTSGSCRMVLLESQTFAGHCPWEKQQLYFTQTGKSKLSQEQPGVWKKKQMWKEITLSFRSSSLNWPKITAPSLPAAVLNTRK